MENIAVQGHLPDIGPGVGNARLGHAPLYLGQLVSRDHHMKVPVTLAPGRQRSSRSRLRLWAGGSFTLSSSFFSGPLGSGEGGRLFKMPSSILSFCSSESSTVSRWLSFSFIVSSLSVLMGLVVFGLVGLLRRLRPAGRLLELCRDGGGRPVRVSRRRAQLVICHLLFRQGLQIGQLAPCPYRAALHHAPLVKVDDLHGSVAGRLREGAEVNRPLGGIVAVIRRRLPATCALLHLKQLLVIVNALGEVLFRCLAVAVVMAPIVVPLAVFRFGKLPCDKGAGGRLVIAQGKAPSIVESNGFQNLIALVDFYVVSSFPASGQLGPRG